MWRREVLSKSQQQWGVFSLPAFGSPRVEIAVDGPLSRGKGA